MIQHHIQIKGRAQCHADGTVDFFSSKTDDVICTNAETSRRPFLYLVAFLGGL